MCAQKFSVQLLLHLACLVCVYVGLCFMTFIISRICSETEMPVENAVSVSCGSLVQLNRKTSASLGTT